MYAQPGQLKNLYSLTTTVSDNVKRFVEEVNPKIEALLKHIGCNEGIAWVQEMLDDDNNVYIIEMGYRLPGDMTFIQYENLIGFDTVAWLVDYALGGKHNINDLPAPQKTSFVKCGCSYNLWVSAEGVLKEITGIEEILKVPGVSYHSNTNVGDFLRKHGHIGTFAFVTEDCKEMCHIIDKINRTVKVIDESGNDLMIGQSGKTSATTFRYLGGDGQDTIKSFDFATSADAAGDLIDITTANEVTTVSLSGGNVILYINGSETDYLTLAQGKGNDFRINNLVAQVDDRQLAFDGLANCYVANGSNATLAVDASVESAEIWLNDMGGGLHGTYYLGDITVVDGSRSAGQLILTGNALDNTILGGAGTNSIWGGYGCDNDVMTGGSGQNTFFFALVNGNDVIQGAHDGDVIDLTTVKTTDIVGTQITDSGTAIGLWDGSVLEVRSNAAVEYKTADGTYMADHASGQWVKTK